MPLVITFASSAIMADVFSSFLDFRPLCVAKCDLQVLLPSKNFSFVCFQSRGSRICRMKGWPHHLSVLSRPSSPVTPSSNFDVISTHDHSDGSIIFRFGDPSKTAKIGQMEESEAEEKELERLEDGDSEREVNDTDLTEMNGKLDSGRRTVGVVDQESDSREKLLENSSSFRPNATDFNVDSSTQGSNVESIENMADGMSEEHEDSRLTSLNVLGDNLIIESSITSTECPENDSFHGTESVGTIGVSLFSKNPSMEVDIQNGLVEDGAECETSVKSLPPKLELEVVNQNLPAGTEAQISVNGTGLPNEEVSRSDVIQLTSVSPQLEAGTTTDGESGDGTAEEYGDAAATGSLMALDNEPQNQILGPECAEDVDYVKNDLTSEEVQVADFVLSSGAALLPHPSKVLTGGEDAYFVAGQTWLGVADGVGQWSLEGTNPGVYAQELMKNCERLVSEFKCDSIKHPVELLRLSIAESHSAGSSTVLLAKLVGQVLHVAKVGDSEFIVLRHGSIYKNSSPMLHAFQFPLLIEQGEDPSNLAEFHKIDLEEEDVIIIATDGLFDNLYDQEIASETLKSLKDNKKLEEIAKVLATKAQAVGRSASLRSPFADDAHTAGYAGYTGGVLDDVAVVVSVVQRRPSS